METLVVDGTVTLIAIAVLVLELAVLLFIRRRGVRVADSIANAFSGLFLMLALRSSLTGHGATAIAACLGLALVAHVVGLATRWKR